MTGNIQTIKMMNKIDEIKLIARCIMFDDRNAFGMIVEAYNTDIRRFFLNLTGDANLSDDLAQETFIKTYMSLGKFKGLSGLKTWIYRIAYNEFYNWTRKIKEQRFDDHTDMVSNNSEESNNIQIDVSNAIQRLSPPERTVITLYFMEDKPIKEIAKITSMPEGTVKSHLSRAKNKLSVFLNKYYNERK